VADQNTIDDFFDNLIWSETSTSASSNLEQKALFGGDLSNIDEWIRHEEFRLKKKNDNSERKLREKNATSALWFSASWAIFIIVVILLHGFGKCFSFFELTQTEFLFIIGTLTTSIFTFYTLVLKYLFYRKETAKENKPAV
jgi:hypothetical protein